MKLPGVLFLLSLQPLLSPSYPWPLPDSLSSPEELSAPGGASSVKPPPFFPEHLEFSVKWGILQAGIATLSMTQAVTLAQPSPFGGERQPPRAAYKIVSTAVSKGLAEAVYKVRDLNESWIDAETMGSLAYMKKLREGTFWRDEFYRYFPREGRFVMERTNRNGSREVRQGVIPSFVQDVFSALYYVRLQPLEIGKDVIVDVNSAQNWPLVVHVLRRETIKVPAGTFDCFVVEPTLRAEGIFIQKGKKLTVWLTADEKRVPVRMDVEVWIGHISARLQRSGPS